MKNARAKIVTASDKRTKQTVTVDRDWDAPDVEITTERFGSGSRTRLNMRGFGRRGCRVNLELNGHEARTLYRVLDKHYGTAERVKHERERADEWRSVATQNAAEKFRLSSDLDDERFRHARTRDGLLSVSGEMLKTVMVDMPQLAMSAFAAGKDSMRAAAEAACKVAYRSGMSKGFEAAQQLELFSELGGVPH